MNLTDLTEIREAGQGERLDLFIRKVYGKTAEDSPGVAIDVQLGLRKLQKFWIVPEIRKSIRIESEDELGKTELERAKASKIVISETRDGRVIKISDKPVNAFSFLRDVLGIGLESPRTMAEIQAHYPSLASFETGEATKEWYADIITRICDLLTA